MDRIVKDFGATRALAEVSVTVQPRQVHALVGHNGSGKSTLIKILAGYHRPDSGSVTVNGVPVTYPTDAIAMQHRGIYFMHQDIGLAPRMTVLENLRIIAFSTGFAGHIRWRAEREQAARLLAQFQLRIGPDDPVDKLSATERAILGVMRAFQAAQRDPANSLVVLDEPTAFLPRDDVERLFGVIRQVARAGCAVLLVTHHIDEPFAIADQVTVLRNGHVAASAPVAALSAPELVRLIVGGDVSSLDYQAGRGEQLVSVAGLAGGRLASASFDGHAGEILGLTGLTGAGHEDVPYLLCGARPKSSGGVELRGEPYPHPTPAESVRRGTAFLPADRQHEAGIPKATVRENVTLSHLPAFRTALGRVHKNRERTAVQQIIDMFGILPRQPEAALSQLSGGNQQKALLARWLAIDPLVLLLHEPTQGVDIGSCHEIFSMLQQHAAQGRLVIMASNQYEDLARVCTRVLIFRNGRIAGEVSGEDLTPGRLLAESYSI